MLKDIVYVEALEGHRLRLRFEDGVEGVLDVSELVTFRGVFAPLKAESGWGHHIWPARQGEEWSHSTSLSSRAFSIAV